MSPDVQILLSGALTFGVPLAFAVRELWVLRRDGAGGGCRERDPTPSTPPTPDPAGVRRPLPDCLIPKPLPTPAARQREVEHA